MEQQQNRQRFPAKIFGMSANLVKSIVLALVGLAIQLTLFLLKKGKTRRLEEIQKEEEEARQRELEEQWKASQIQNEPELAILRELSDTSAIEPEAYDGELSQLNFTHIKDNQAFKPKPDVRDLFDISEFDENEETREESVGFKPLSKYQSSLDQDAIIKSEDGWRKSQRR